MIDRNFIWDILSTIPDPEIPVLSLVELGMVRDVAIDAEEGVVITITPTYSGCPALAVIEHQIKDSITPILGGAKIRIKTALSPAWTTDWLNSESRQKLHDYGIAPPPQCAHAHHAGIHCPHCGSENNEMLSASAATPCQSLHRCRDCLEPFTHFKCH